MSKSSTTLGPNRSKATSKRSSSRGRGAKGANGIRRKVLPLSEIMNMNIPRDKFMLCLGGFLLVALCLAGWGVVLASHLEFSEPFLDLTRWR